MMIRCFEEKDREAVKNIAAICFEGVSIDCNIEARYGVINGLDWKTRKKRDIDQDLNKNPEGVFVAEENGAPVGFITTVFDSDTLIGRIPNLSVLSCARGKGLGRKLIDCAVEYLKNKGMKYIQIETLEQNSLTMDFYPKEGFQEIAGKVYFIRPL